MRNLFIVLCLININVHAQVSIGWDASCDYDMNADSNAVQQAIDDGMTELRLTNENDYMTRLNIRNQIKILGGYSNCQDAINGIQTNINSTINAANAIGFSTLFIFDITNADILLDSLTIINGSDSGIYMNKLDGLVTLNHLEVSSNTGVRGSGIYIQNNNTLTNPDNLIVEIKNSVINQNQASFAGGGLGCLKSGNVAINIMLLEGSVVQSNHADVTGGGIYLFGCDLLFNAGVNAINNGHLELFDNTSNGSGGGLSLQDGIVEFTGDFNRPFDINGNYSGFSGQSNSSGGGVWVVGSSEVTIINGLVNSNISQQYGAGLYTSAGSNITMDIAPDGCGYSEYCSSLNSNQLLTNFGGGAAIAATGGSVTVNRTLIGLNNANGFGYISYANNNGVIKLEGNLILGNGGQNGFANENGLYLQDTASLSMYYNTTDKNSSSMPFIRADSNSTVNMVGNIIDENGNILNTVVTVSTNINCNMFTQINNITAPMIDTIVDNAIFLDPNDGVFGNFKLHVSSTSAMDVCSFVTYLPGNDLSNSQRGLDNVNVPEVNGFYDLGAYEFFRANEIFQNSFE